MRALVLSLVVSIALAGVAEAKTRNVAIVAYEDAEILDFAGPAEVLASAAHHATTEDGKPAFQVYVVARTMAPLHAQGFITITPNYSIENAPPPDVIVIPGGNSAKLSDDPAMMKWLTEKAARSEVTLTVCTGAFPLAKAGALDGLTVTTWFGAIDALRAAAPRVHVEDGRRFVDNGRYVTTAGVSAGIDGALHVTARLLGRRVADTTARYMEYHWTPEPYLAKAYVYWNPSTDDRGRALQQAEAAVEERHFGDAIASYRRAATSRPLAIRDVYNLACAYALAGQRADALRTARRALALGVPVSQALADPDLASIHADLGAERSASTSDASSRQRVE